VLPEDVSRPQFARGCRWVGGAENEADGEKTVVFPEGAIRVQGTGRAILELCDGQKTFREIIEELRLQYGNADSARMRDDAAKFLESLQRKRIIDY